MAEGHKILVNGMTQENGRYFNKFTTTLNQINDRFRKGKRTLRENLEADLRQLSQKNKAALDFYVLPADKLARGWANELPVPKFRELITVNGSAIFGLSMAYFSVARLLEVGFQADKLLALLLAIATYLLVTFLVSKYFGYKAIRVRTVLYAVSLLLIAVALFTFYLITKG